MSCELHEYSLVYYKIFAKKKHNVMMSDKSSQVGGREILFKNELDKNR